MFKVFRDFFKKIRELPDQGENIRRKYRLASIPVEEPVLLNDYEESEEKKGPGLGMSMLDIIACGLGAVTLVAVLHMLIKIPLPPPLSKDFILAEIRMKGAAEIGFAIKHEQNDWLYIFQNKSSANSVNDVDQLLDQGMAISLDYSNSYEGCNADQERHQCEYTIAHLHIDQPAIGYWHIEPYLYSHRTQNDISTIGDIGRVTCLYWTRTDDFMDTDDNCFERNNPVSSRNQVQVFGQGIDIKK